METLSLFLFKSIVISGLLTAWYFLGLRGRRLHRYNRLFLLTALFASIAIPFLHLRLFSVSHTAASGLAPVALFVQPAGDPGSSLPITQNSPQTQFDWQIVIGTIAATISLALILILMIRILKVRRMWKQYPSSQVDGVTLIQTDLPQAPFTFLKYMFWNSSIPLDSETGRLIFRHEMAHIVQRHTYDKLICQALTCICWFNPFYWIIQKELNIVHEFIADENAVNNRDTETFAMMVLQTYNNGSYLVPEHHFFSSTIKRRLAMLQNAATPSFAALRRFMVLPVIAGAILMFSCSFRNGLTSRASPAKKKIVVLIDPAHGGADAGAQSDGYKEKDITLKCARRIKELSPTYNIEVHLTRDNDQAMQLADRVAVSKKITPEVFISLHVDDEPGKEKAKGDFDIYVSGERAYARQSSNFSSSIFQAMGQDGIIPGTDKKCNHAPGVTCSNCRKTAGKERILSTKKEGIYILKNASVPCMVMVLGNIKSTEDVNQLTDNDRLDVLCNAILKGIVEGSAENNRTGFMQNIPDINNGFNWNGCRLPDRRSAGCGQNTTTAVTFNFAKVTLPNQ